MVSVVATTCAGIPKASLHTVSRAVAVLVVETGRVVIWETDGFFVAESFNFFLSSAGDTNRIMKNNTPVCVCFSLFFL